MAFVFNFPDVGEGIHEGRVVEWLVAEGDTVAEDQAMLKVETDKAVVELPSPHTGTVLRLHVAADAAIFVGDALVTIGSPDEKLPEDKASPAEASTSSASVPVQVDVGAPAGPAVAARRPLATPRTRALARKLAVDLSQIVGSGSGGRITDEDVQRAADGGGVAPTAPAVPPTRWSSTPAVSPSATVTASAGRSGGRPARHRLAPAKPTLSRRSCPK